MEGLYYLPRDLRILHWSRQATYGPEGVRERRAGKMERKKEQKSERDGYKKR